MSSPSPKTVSLILPVLNREERLPEVLAEIRSKLANLNGEVEIVVVYDVTKPEMLAAVKREQQNLQERFGIRAVTRVDQRGFGSALRAGFEASSGQVIVPIMADCSDDIGVIPQMLAKIDEGAGVVAGSRYMPGGAIVGDTPKQRLSRLYSVVMRSISRVRCEDVSNSFKAYRREVWETIPNEATSFDISVEMTVKAAAAGFPVAQVPAVWTNRQAGSSSFRMLREFRNYSRWYIYAARHLPSRFFLLGAILALPSMFLVLLGLSWPLRRPGRHSHG